MEVPEYIIKLIIYKHEYSILSKFFTLKNKISIKIKIAGNLIIKIASGSGDNTIKLWNSRTGECLSTLNGHTSSVRCLIKINETVIASGSCDNTIKLWNSRTGECLR